MRLHPCPAALVCPVLLGSPLPAPPGLSPVPWIEALTPAGLPAAIPDAALARGPEREGLVRALAHSLAWLDSPAAPRAYATVGGEPWRRQVRASVAALLALLRGPLAGEALKGELQAAFEPYRLSGEGGNGVLHITGYHEAWAEASRTRRPGYTWPLYRKPTDLARWPRPHPTRAELEGRDGRQGPKGALKGLELVWLKDRLEAYMVHVQGSGRLLLPDGTEMTVGYAGRTDHPYVSIGQELEKDLLQKEQRRTLNGVMAHFREHPDLLDDYLPRNPRFVFFAETKGAPPKGSLGVPVTAGRSLALDKAIFPPGAPILLYAEIPLPTEEGQPPRPWTQRFAVDQDAGGAITGPGRIDVFCGGGPEGKAVAGGINGPGRAYLLLLKSATSSEKD